MIMDDQMEYRKGTVRVSHRAERLPISERNNTGRYFAKLRDGYEQIYCWTWNRDEDPYRSEVAFYAGRYMDWIVERNQKAAKNRQWKRIISPESIHSSQRSCPEELTVRIGRENGEWDMPNPYVFECCILQYIGWMQKWRADHADCLHVLGAYISNSVPCEAIIRRVWDYDADGIFRKIGQARALVQAGVPCPDKSDEPSRYNNRKITFDQISREMIYRILENAGIELIREP